MDDGMDIRPHTIDQQVHADFASYVSAPRDALALKVDDYQVGGPHRALTHASGSYQDLAVGAAHREISVHSRDESALVKHPPVADNFFPLFAIAGHEFLQGSSYSRCNLAPA